MSNAPAPQDQAGEHDQAAERRRPFEVVALLASLGGVEAVADGAAALEAARARPPDLVLAEVLLPQLDGWELLQRLRADEALRAIRVILLAARAGDELGAEGFARGADDVILKPFSAHELVTRVERQQAATDCVTGDGSAEHAWKE